MGMVIKSKFEMSINFVLPHEGGYVNDPSDPGGETNYGISKRKYPEVNIRDLTIADAIAIYRRDYWDRFNCDVYRLPLCVAIFDAFVQHRTEVVKDMIAFAGGDWKKFITARRDFYGRLVAKNSSLQKFMFGWTKRLNDLSKYCQEIEQTPMLS